LLLFKAFTYCNGNKNEKQLYCVLKKFLFATFYKRRIKNVKLTADFRNVSENFDAEIFSNLDSVRGLLKKCPSEFKFEELLAEKRRKRIYLLKF